MAKVAVHIVVKGRVQGVGYRAWTVRLARQCGLRGWVRNRHDGSVEMLLIGEEADVEAAAQACQHGPNSAHVVHITRTPTRDDGSMAFEARSTV